MIDLINLSDWCQQMMQGLLHRKVPASAGHPMNQAHHNALVALRELQDQIDAQLVTEMERRNAQEDAA